MLTFKAEVLAAWTTTLKTHSRLLGGRCTCGAWAQDEWQFTEHLLAEVADAVARTG